MIAPEDEALWLARYRGPQPEASLAYAKRLACEYAELHTSGMPHWVQAGVASLHFKNAHPLADDGDKRLIRISIDVLLTLGRMAKEATP